MRGQIRLLARACKVGEVDLALGILTAEKPSLDMPGVDIARGIL